MRILPIPIGSIKQLFNMIFSAMLTIHIIDFAPNLHQFDILHNIIPQVLIGPKIFMFSQLTDQILVFASNSVRNVEKIIKDGLVVVCLHYQGENVFYYGS